MFNCLKAMRQGYTCAIGHPPPRTDTLMVGEYLIYRGKIMKKNDMA